MSMNLDSEGLAKPIVELDKSAFDFSLPLTALIIPRKTCNEYMTQFKSLLFERPKMKRVLEVPADLFTSAFPKHLNGGEESEGVSATSGDYRILLLSENISEGPSDFIASLPDSLREFNDRHGGKAVKYDLSLGYDHLSVEEVLKRILPTTITATTAATAMDDQEAASSLRNTEIPSSFEQAGHLAHLNLRPDALPYKRIIGQVILDKNPSIRTVVNKIGNIETEFRTFPMEVIAGEEDFHVTLRESGAKFTFNFRDVYWNSRLQTEHQRLIDVILASSAQESDVPSDSITSVSATTSVTKMKKTALNQSNNSNSNSSAARRTNESNVVADMMAGVGPFAVPLAMQEVSVHANDLNPASHTYLLKNARLNQCSERSLKAYNLDGRDFIVRLTSSDASARDIRHVIMNLPQSATDFLDVFIGYFHRFGSGPEAHLPCIHVYAFSTDADPIRDIALRVAGVLRCDVALLGQIISTSTLGIKLGSGTGGPKSFAANAVNTSLRAGQCVGHIVRDVAPKKVMVCFSFKLPREVALADPIIPMHTEDSIAVVGLKRNSHESAKDADQEEDIAKRKRNENVNGIDEITVITQDS